MSEDIIRYDILVQNALRGVIRKVLSEVEKTGLPGNHHFFITFVTTAPGVRISNRIREQYPEQMTIVLQHQFWDLEIGETGFGIGLSFSDVPEKLYVPYAAVRGFYDPSVNFELEFDVADGDAEAGDDGAANADEPAAEGPARQDDSETVTEAPAKYGEDEDGTADVVSLDAFRKKK
jgi:hypothetical protein